LAREYNDDVTGKEREGDIGWLHRRNPGTAQFLAGCFLVEPGELLDLTQVKYGWLVIRRER
ncbi:MAG: hypothetical protein O7B99_04540, partial [Planctomycetota bacterium]|nr:hypothetical protein [Planctomycetota bacterium]